jgi:hypothetical protein
MNFKEEFLKLTQFTTPYKSESDLEPYLISKVPGLMKDGIGNYHKIIGNSETLFVCHLDNFCKTKQRVHHIIDDEVIMTDGNTILGADNKAGVLVLLYLISNNVPGHYCFFIGEEPILSGGLYGSSLFANYYKDIKKFKRAIAFDRKEEASVITRQMAQECCSDTFAAALCNAFIEQELWMEPDCTGYYTDTASFLEHIPECTNISVGVWGEHTTNEYIDIFYLERVARAAANINWEELPSIREAKCWLKQEEEIDGIEVSDTQKGIADYLYKLIKTKLSNYGFLCMNTKPFMYAKPMIFNNWFKDFILTILVQNEQISINGYIIPALLSALTDEEISDSDLETIIGYIEEDMRDIENTTQQIEF